MDADQEYQSMCDHEEWLWRDQRSTWDDADVFEFWLTGREFAMA